MALRNKWRKVLNIVSIMPFLLRKMYKTMRNIVQFQRNQLAYGPRAVYPFAISALYLNPEKGHDTPYYLSNVVNDNESEESSDSYNLDMEQVNVSDPSEVCNVSENPDLTETNIKYSERLMKSDFAMEIYQVLIKNIELTREDEFQVLALIIADIFTNHVKVEEVPKQKKQKKNRRKRQKLNENVNETFVLVEGDDVRSDSPQRPKRKREESEDSESLVEITNVTENEHQTPVFHRAQGDFFPQVAEDNNNPPTPSDCSNVLKRDPLEFKFEENLEGILSPSKKRILDIPTTSTAESESDDDVTMYEIYDADQSFSGESTLAVASDEEQILDSNGEESLVPEGQASFSVIQAQVPSTSPCSSWEKRKESRIPECQASFSVIQAQVSSTSRCSSSEKSKESRMPEGQASFSFIQVQVPSTSRCSSSAKNSIPSPSEYHLASQTEQSVPLGAITSDLARVSIQNDITNNNNLVEDHHRERREGGIIREHRTWGNLSVIPLSRLNNSPTHQEEYFIKEVDNIEYLYYRFSDGTCVNLNSEVVMHPKEQHRVDQVQEQPYIDNVLNTSKLSIFCEENAKNLETEHAVATRSIEGDEDEVDSRAVKRPKRSDRSRAHQPQPSPSNEEIECDPATRIRLALAENSGSNVFNPRAIFEKLCRKDK